MKRHINNNEHYSIADFEVEQIELRGFSRSIAEIEWLLLLLVILYYVSPNAQIDNYLGVQISLELFGAFVLGFHYLNSDAPQYRWKLALETWVMIVFITWVLWNTGNIESPLLNLYFLVIICSAITLGKIITFLEIALIGAFYLFLAFGSGTTYSISALTDFLSFFCPFVLVAYITTMLVADVSFSRKIFKTLSETDEMTSLLNKRSFAPMFQKAAELAEGKEQPLSVMMIDADNLKEINDTHGHIAGDELILNVASIIQDCLRTTDIICRYGGDEFVALLPRIPKDRAFEVGERVRMAVEDSFFAVEGKVLRSTVSIGVATFPNDVENADQLLEKSDEMLYQSKSKGRNKVLSQAEKRIKPL